MNDSSGKSMTRAVITLLLLTAAAALLLAWGNRMTADQRQLNQTAYAARLLTEVLPPDLYDEPPGLESGLLELPDRPDAPVRFWPARRDDTVTAVVLEVTAAEGYVGPIELLVGIERSGTVTGVRVASHRETPGLGDAIEAGRSDWITGFDELSLRRPPPSDWALRRDGGDIDQISGATVTSRAVTAAVRRALELHEANLAKLYPGD